MTNIVIRGPVSQSGFGVATIGLVKVAINAGFNVNFIPVLGSKEQHEVGMNNKTKDFLNKITINSNDDIIKSSTVIDVGSLISGLSIPKLKCDQYILYCTTETTNIHPNYVQMLNFKYDEIWTATRFNKLGFKSSGVTNKIEILPHTIDTDIFNTNVKPLKIKNKKSFNYIVNMDFSYRKGLHLLLPAWEEAFHEDDDVSLIIKMTSGNFTDQETTRKILNELCFQCNIYDKPHAKILFMPQMLDEKYIPNLYATADIYISPNLGEGFGLTIAEAMACGLPTITSRCGGPLDYISSKNSYLINIDSKMPTQEIKDESLLRKDPHYKGTHIYNIDKDSLVKQLRNSYANKQLVLEKGKQARLDIVNKLSINVVSKIFTKLINTNIEEII